MCTATFIEQFESLKAENARLSERVRELEAEKRILKDEMEAVDQMLAARNERIESLEAQLDKLHGHKFSERDFTAIASRAETAETRVKELEEGVRRWKEESRGWATMYKTAEARLAQAERLLRSKADRLHIPCGNHWLPDPDVAAFLHPKQEKLGERTVQVDESAESRYKAALEMIATAPDYTNPEGMVRIARAALEHPGRSIEP